MATALFDIEANGLKPTKVHCIGLQEAAPNTTKEMFRPHQLRDAIARLEEFDTVVAHNGVVYDVPVIVRLLGFKPKRVRDSLVLSRQLFGNIRDALDKRLYARTKAHKIARAEAVAKRETEITTLRDTAAQEGWAEEAINERLPPPLPPDDFIGFPGNMQGRHGIEAWGFRFNMYKGDYAKQMQKKGLDPWAEFNEDMFSYMGADIDILYHLWMNYIRPSLLGYVTPFSVDVEIKETFRRLDAREWNTRKFKLPIELPTACFTADKPFDLGALLVKELQARPTSIQAHAKPMISQIKIKNFPGYCSIETERPSGDSSRQYISMQTPTYIDRKEMIANEEEAAKEEIIDVAGALRGQSKNRQLILKPLNAERVLKAGTGINDEFLKALGHAKIYSHGTTAARAVEIEHYMAVAMADLEDSGILLDPVALKTLIDDLNATKKELEDEIKAFFPPRLEPKKWVIRTFAAGPGDSNTRSQSKFPLGRILFPKQKAHIPQRNLPEGYKREYWGQSREALWVTRAKGLAKRRDEEFVDTRDVARGSDAENTPEVRDGDFTPVHFKPINPGSREQLARRLMEQGWAPDSWTETGGPSLDDIALSKLAKTLPIAETIRLYLVVVKRLGQITQGKSAWTKMAAEDGMVHPHINPCGTVTARAAHSNPNISAVPTVMRVKVAPTPDNPKGTKLAFGREGEWGADCRRLFTVPNKYRITYETHPELFGPAKNGNPPHVSAAAVAAFDPSYYLVVGADLAGIELRMLAHYLRPYDGGKFAALIMDPSVDIHETNRVILQFANREDAKRFLFALLYGAGDEMLGAIYNPTGSVAEQKIAGRMFRDRLMAGISGFKDLVDSLRKDAHEGNILALDGRLIPVRSAHSALNTLLQSGGALVSKYWIREANRRITTDLGLVYDKTWSKPNGYSMLLWSHDETQNAMRAKYASAGAAILEEAAAATEKILGLNIPIKAEAKVGLNWLDTH